MQYKKCKKSVKEDCNKIKRHKTTYAAANLQSTFVLKNLRFLRLLASFHFLIQRLTEKL
jgi:hypothetical protein